MTTEFYYSAFAAITSFAVGITFFYYIWRNNILTPTRSFFWHYSIGFLFLGFSHSQSLWINSGAQIDYLLFVTLRIFSLLVTIIAYSLFISGTTSLFLKERLMLKLLFLFYGSTLAAFFIYSVLMTEIDSIIITTVVLWGFVLPVNIFLGCAFLYLFLKGIPFDTVKKQPSAIILSFAWFYVFILGVILWFSLVAYSRDFYLLKLAASKEWFLARAIGHLLILIGFILYCRYLRRLKIPEYLKFQKGAREFTTKLSE
jgi:hypothetical protein